MSVLTPLLPSYTISYLMPGRTLTAAAPRRGGGQSRGVDPVRLRAASSCFATGVVVVSCEGDDGAHGLTVNSFTTVSLEPPLVLVSIARRARACQLLSGRPFGVNVLDAQHERLAAHFAGRPDPSLGVDWESGVLVPLLAQSLASFECEPWRAYEGGDHVLFVGRVVHSANREGDGLGFFRSSFCRVAAPAAAGDHHYDPFELPYDAP